MALYALNLASLLAMPVPFGSGSILAMLWQLPMTPAMTAINSLSSSGTALQYVLFALLAAIEPMCLTLGLTGGKKNPANNVIAPAGEITDNKENHPHA